MLINIEQNVLCPCYDLTYLKPPKDNEAENTDGVLWLTSS